MNLQSYPLGKCRYSLLIILLCLFSFNSLAVIRYVKQGATGSGATWATASGDLQLMINNSLSGDQVWVAAGIYQPIRPANNLGVKSLNNRDNAFVLKKDVKVYGGFYGNESILGFRNWAVRITTLSGDIGVAGVSTDNCYHVVISSGDIGTATLDGFIINDGNGNLGTSISVNGTLIPRSSGGGINISNSSPTIANCIVSKNQASNGGGISAVKNILSIAPIINGCLITGNFATADGGGVFNSNASLAINNCTIASNLAASDGGGFYFTGLSSSSVNNSIFYFNKVGITTNNIEVSGFASLTVSYCIVEGGYVGTGNINSDPLFVNPLPASAAPVIDGDYHIQKCSPALNGGSNSLVPASVTKDLDCHSRIFTGIVDIGSYESNLVFAIPDVNGIVYVDITKNGDGSSWINAVQDLSDALVAARYNTVIKQIWVAKGTYKPQYSAGTSSLSCSITNRDNAFVLVKDVKLLGGFAGGETDSTGRNFIVNETILSGNINTPGNTDNCYHILISAGNIGTAMVNGFSFTDGTAIGGGDIIVNSINIERHNGAAIFNASSFGVLTVESCNIHHNTASAEAGGFFSNIGSEAVIKNCSFTSNTVSSIGNGGAAIYNEPLVKITISNCSFTSNISLTSTPGYGGAILNSTGVLANISYSTFINNQSNNGGAIHNNSCTPKLFGCTFINNSAIGGDGGAISNYQTITGSIIDSCIINSNVTNTGTGNGGGIYNNNSVLTINNTSITGNRAQLNGGGIYYTGINSNIKISKSNISENIAAVGAGIYDFDKGYLLLDKCIVSGNSAAATSGLYIQDGTIDLYNSLISGNKTNGARPALHLYGSIARVIGTTIVSNSQPGSADGSGILLDNSPSYNAGLTLINSVVWGNRGGVKPIKVNSPATASVSYSLIEGGFTGTGNFNIDPLFVNPLSASAAPTTGGDYRIKKCSPAVDAGDNSSIPVGITTDLDGNPRIINSQIDMGAYEQQYAVSNAIGIVYVDKTKSGDGSSWAKATPELADALKGAKYNSSITEIWVAKGTYYPLYDAATLGCAPTDLRDKSFVLVSDVKVYGGFAGGETDTIGRDFVVNETILSGDINNDDVITGSGATLTISNNSENVYHIAISAGNVGNAIFDGFTITKGNSDGNNIVYYVNGELLNRLGGGGMYLKRSSLVLNNCLFYSNSAGTFGGGGLYMSTSSPIISNSNFVNNITIASGGAIFANDYSPVISNCNFKGNNAGSGGGGLHANLSSSIITDCIFESNYANIGAGIANGVSSTTIKNCIIISNSAITYGGGISTQAILTNCIISGNFAPKGGGITINNGSLINCTISGNKSTISAAGISNSSSSSIIKNCIVWGNKVGAITSNIAGTAPIVNYSLIEGGYAGAGNIKVNPQFVSPQPASAAPTILGDYRLQSCSPAINIGNNASIPLGTTTDLDNNPRIQFTDVDLGAYELQTQDLTQSTWRGYNTNWNDKVNWCGGFIPLATTNVTVPSGLTNYPSVAATNEVKNISFANASSIEITPAGQLTINGTYANSGSTITNNGTLTMSGTSINQTFPGPAATVSAMNNLEINNPSGITFNKSFSISGSLIPTAGNININNVDITLSSTLNGTASVDVIQPAASISYTGTGAFIAERFVNTGTNILGGEHGKSWQLLATPTNGQTFYDSWQEGGTTPAGYGTIITGTGTGFDITTPLPSLKTYDDATNTWIGITNTQTPLQNNLGYLLFVRGDRTVTAYNALANSTNLRSRGKIFSPSNPPPNISVQANKFQSIGNPYASRIEFSKVFASSTGIDDYFYVWDPKLNGNYHLGGYQIISSLTGYLPNAGVVDSYYEPLTAYPYLESGQAFFVRGSALGGNVSFNEKVKAKGSRLVARPQNTTAPSMLFVSLFTAEGAMADGTVAVFDDGLNNDLNNLDAIKLTNPGENLGMHLEESILGVQARELPTQNDTIFFYQKNLKKVTYQLRFAPLNMQSQLQGLLVDRFTGSVTPVSMFDSSFYTFQITADSASSNAERFFMIFKEFQILALPVLQINVVKAEGNNTAVKFSIESGDELQQCWLEHSIDGRNYSRIKLINYESISQLRNYFYTIETPLNQCNFYRLNGTSISGRELYSNVVSLCREMNTLISVYPNPVINDYVNVRMQGMEKGFYEISISNITGQVLYYKGINIKHFNELLGINTKPFLKQGTFILTIRNDKGIVQSFKLVVF